MGFIKSSSQKFQQVRFFRPNSQFFSQFLCTKSTKIDENGTKHQKWRPQSRHNQHRTNFVYLTFRHSGKQIKFFLSLWNSCMNQMSHIFKNLEDKFKIWYKNLLSKSNFTKFVSHSYETSGVYNDPKRKHQFFVDGLYSHILKQSLNIFLALISLFDIFYKTTIMF